MKLAAMALFVLSAPSTQTVSFYCHMVSDGSVYCFAHDGHIFRPRFDDFIMTVPKAH
jgi:hypothetical protein